MEWSVWLAFFVASWAISLSPGPGAVAAMTAGLNHGFRKGYWIAAGLIAGIWVQILLVGVGMGAILAASSTAFLAVKWLGVAYLVWLGIAQFRASALPLEQSAEGIGQNRRQLALKGLLINCMNPKGTVFMLAVVPQFLNPAAPLLPQYLIIAATLAFTDMVVMAGYTALASRVLKVFKTPRQIKWLNRTFGGLFIAAGAFLAAFRRGA
jgi:homoserine/homoserine lactone efflux protein